MRRTLSQFDIGQIADSGQCFRLVRTAPDTFVLTAGSDWLEIRQSGSEVIFSCDEEEFEGRWRKYFDLDTDYGAIQACIKEEDSYMRRAASFGSGIRILRQDSWEMLITFILSQRNNIPRIRKCVESLCRTFGTRCTNLRGDIYYAFPTPAQLHCLNEAGFHACGLGYRKRYIQEAAAAVDRGSFCLEALEGMDYETAKSELMKLCGVGVKVADCICLFALHHIEAFPVDTHIERVLKEQYPQGFPFERYAGFAGILQQYAFYYDLNKPIAG